MTEEENVKLVSESVRTFRVEGLDEWAKLWHPDATLISPEGWPEQGPFVGLPAVRRQFERLLDSFSSFDFNDFEIVASSRDWVVASFRIAVRGAGSGLDSELNLGVAYRADNGLLAECVVCWELAEALEAAGLQD